MTDDQECTCAMHCVGHEKAGLVGEKQEASRGSGKGKGLCNVLLGLYY